MSLSHKGNDVCVCVARAGSVGVDIESVEPRVESFYRSNYTEREKRWVGRGAGIEPLSRNWLYTLLWTFKEGALKARALMQQSPVSFSGVEVGGLPVSQGVLQAFRKDRWGDQFGLFTARIQEERSTTCAHVAYMGTRRLILAVVQPFDPAQHVHSAVMS